VVHEEVKVVSRVALNKMMREQKRITAETEATRRQRMARKFGYSLTYFSTRFRMLPIHFMLTAD
jgi:hypothetical protein